MARTIRVAAIQMDANPAHLQERLNRAEKIITEAAHSGAQLIILPELFNVGYTYSDDNFSLVEPMDGTTSSWMKATAARLKIHLAGTLLISEQGEIYNSLLLFSPSGQQWRYDKNYPWAWERGYFRERRGVTVANTELGDLGMLICWDVGHARLWKQYAGRVDMIVIASCPPDAPNATYEFPGGDQVRFTDLGKSMASVLDSGLLAFGTMVDQQARWLGVPVANSGATGSIRTQIPRAKSLLWSFLAFAPRLMKQFKNADQMQMSTDMMWSCKVVDANGEVLAKRMPNEGEGFVMSEVPLPEQKIKSRERQPKSPLHPLAYLNADWLVPWLMQSIYRNGKKLINSHADDSSYKINITSPKE